jgi:metal-dependent amidase/aminoacylase/carboxypeptidase family protein
LQSSLKGNVKLIFQPAEEGPGGALPMINEGVLENPQSGMSFLELMSGMTFRQEKLRLNPDRLWQHPILL